MFNRSNRHFKRKESKVLKIKRPNTKAKKILLFFEIVLVGIVLFGTIWGVVRFTEFSFLDFFQENAKEIIPLTLEPKIGEIKQSKSDLLINSLPQEVFKLKKIKEETLNELTLISDDGTVAIFSLTKDTEFQLTTLQNLLTKAKISKKKVKIIDLRYEKAVVVYGD